MSWASCESNGKNFSIEWGEAWPLQINCHWAAISLIDCSHSISPSRYKTAILQIITKMAVTVVMGLWTRNYFALMALIWAKINWYALNCPQLTSILKPPQYHVFVMRYALLGNLLDISDSYFRNCDIHFRQATRLKIVFPRGATTMIIIHNYVCPFPC